MSQGSENVSPDERREREDEAWLMARARGESAEHPDPARAESYLRLERALAALPPPAPGRGWQADVLAAIDARARARRWAYYSLPFAVAALLLLVWAAWPRPVEGAFAPLALTSCSRPSGGVYRGGSTLPNCADAGTRSGELPNTSVDEARGRTRGEHPAPNGDVTRASLGDALVLKAWLSGPGEIRVYRDGGELVLRCPGGEGCAEANEQRRRLLEVSLTPPAPGRYRAVLLGGAALPAPPASEQEHEALRAASKAGAKVVDSLFVEVR
jgi:hypothetical protein